jgi:diketogulonate reductase-like aldo/keto reductase
MLPLTGTTSPEHLAEDLAVFDFELSDADVKTIETVVG